MVSILDIIGPVMVGPSSSHTAGACRLGLLARGLVGGTPERATIELHGSFARTGEGHLQAKQLAEQLAALPIERIISSPFTRARQSIAPLAERLGLPIATDERLAERVLAADDLPNWPAALKASFDDMDRCLAGGEGGTGKPGIGLLR